MSLDSVYPLRQRADYTHKANLKTGRHGWLRLTPAYSVKVVEEIIARCDRPMRIFDPFCGTATTALSAAYHGHHSATTDINPFLIWLAKAKTAHYSATTISAVLDACTRALEMTKVRTVEPTPIPPLHNIERWWPPKALDFLCSLRAAIEANTLPASPERTLLMIAFCRSLIVLSNAAFNHQSMSFKTDMTPLLELDVDMGFVFANDVRFVLVGAAQNPLGVAEVLSIDARNLTDVPGDLNRVITSPPYANRMSYIRELRPYMYWLGFLTSGRDAGELDWTAIGGTWGMATSRLSDWRRSGDCFRSPHLEDSLDKVAHTDNKNGRLLSNYIAKYFDDMWLHLQSLSKKLANGAVVHYIVGNSTFYGNLLSVEKIYAEMLAFLGFENVHCRALRKRNSKKELIEFDVSATWHT